MKNPFKKALTISALMAASLTVQAQTRVNVTHLAPFAGTVEDTAVSVDVDNLEVFSEFYFDEVAGYVTLTPAGVAPGVTQLNVFAPPGAAIPAIQAAPDLLADTDYTVAAIGDITNQPLALLPLVDDNSAPAPGNVKIRIVHAAPFDAVLANTAVSVRDDNDNIIGGLGNVEFGQFSGYLEVPAGVYDLKIATPDGSTTLIDIAPVNLAAGTVVTVFAIGNGSNLPLGIKAIFADGSDANLGLEQPSRALVAHFAPFASGLSDTAVSVNVDAAEILTGVLFNQASGYIDLGPADTAPGTTQLDVFAPPGTPPAAITATFDLAANTDFTIAAVGDGTNQPLQLLPLMDDNSAPGANNVKVRIVHAAPFAATLMDTEVSIRDDDGNVIGGLTNVQFGENSGYLEVPAATYDLQIATPDGSTTLIDIAPVDLAAGTIVTVFAVGDGVNQPLGVTAVFGDGTFAELSLEQPTRAVVAHFAPFSADLNATAVSVDVNMTEVLTGVQFNQASGYLPLGDSGVAPGVTQLDVFAPPGTPPAAITASPDLAANTDYTVAAIGNVTNQPLSLLLLEDDNSVPAPGNVRLRVVHAAPFAANLMDTAVSIRTDGGAIVGGLANVEFGEDSGFLEVPAGMYDLQVATTDGSMSLINPAPVMLAEGTVVTVFAVGDGANQPLGITAIFGDGTSAMLPLEAPIMTVFSEDFSDGSVPAGWNNQDTGPTTNALWTWCADPADDRTTAGCPRVWDDGLNQQLPFAASTSTNGFVTLDSDFYGSIDHVSELTTPSIDLSDAVVATVNFESHIGVFTENADPNAVLRVSTDGGTAWTSFVVFPGLLTGNPPVPGSVRWSFNPNISSIDISSIAAGESDVLLQWQWTGNFEYQWSLDDVSVVTASDPDIIFKNGFD
ncbi:DUF4397 domain-containing protein [Marinicella sp. W31]|uniref:DUF4397 domain-containing protein n=1 Tax=Marinicella sp. W31 TaxID=3023713 RepID=UPI0037567D55